MTNADYPRPTHPTMRAVIERSFSPTTEWCFRCGRPWSYADPHQTPYKPEHGDAGCFPLCENCWSRLTIDERLPYYDRLVDLWIAQDTGTRAGREADRALIRQAVLDAK